MDALARSVRGRGGQVVLGAERRQGSRARRHRDGHTRSPPHRRRRYLGAQLLQSDALGATKKKDAAVANFEVGGCDRAVGRKL